MLGFLKHLRGFMAKQVLSREQIETLIDEEMEKHSMCSGSYAGVYWHREEEGCNWDVDILPDEGSSNTMCEECDDLIQEAVQTLRAKYSISGPD
jgi:hypothetical protein